MADRGRSLSSVPSPAAPTPRRLPPTHQVVLAVGVIVAILAALVVVAIVSLLSLREDQVQLRDRNVPYAVAIATAALNAKGMANDERGYLISGNRHFLVEFDQRLINTRTAFAEAVLAADGDKQHRAVSIAREGFEDWVLAVREEFKVFQRGERRRATRTALGPVRSLRKEYEAELADAQAVATTAIELRRNSFASAGWLMILIEGLIGVVVLGVIVSFWLMRSLHAPARSSPPTEAQPPQARSPHDVGRRHG